MKHQRIHMPTLSYIAAFVIGVIVFAVLWNGFFDSASSVMVLAGMAGVAVMVTAFWIRNEMGHHNTKDK